MVSAQDLCSVFNKVLKDGWGFVPGFDGQVLTRDMLDERVTDATVKQAASKWIGKHVVDAGGIFSHAFKALGIPDNYKSDGTFVQTIFQEYCSQTGKLPKGGLLPGMVMFKKNNDKYTGIGLYVGNSIIIEARSTKVGVVHSRLNSEWTYWGKLKDIEYEELPSKASLRKKDVRDMRVLHGSVVVSGGSEEKVNVREGTSLTTAILDVLPVGTKATVLEDCGEFCKIQYLKTGYMRKTFLKEVQNK